MFRRLNTTALIVAQTKFEAIISKDVAIWGDRFHVKTHASRQILDLGHYNFLPVAPTVMILVFLKSQCRELSKNVYCYSSLSYTSRLMILSSETCWDSPNLSDHPPSPQPLKLSPLAFTFSPYRQKALSHRMNIEIMEITIRVKQDVRRQRVFKFWLKSHVAVNYIQLY